MEQSRGDLAADSSANEADYFLVRRLNSPMLARGCGARGKHKGSPSPGRVKLRSTRRANLRVLAQAGGR